MLIHFICKGNTYRSRLAEAYLRSKAIPSIKVISSGTEAKKDINGPITWEAERIIKRNHLIFYMSTHWRQTTKELLDTSDLNIFMDKSIYEYCKTNFVYDKNNYQIWDVHDIDESEFARMNSMQDEINRVKISEETFRTLKEKIDALISSGFHNSF